MQVLFLWDTHGVADEAEARQLVADGAGDEAVREAAVALARGAWENRVVADQWVERLAPQWPPRRQPAVDRNLIRLGVWEITGTQTPPKVAIDEAIELAKEFSTSQSAAFVNGVLDAVLKEHQALVQGVAPPPHDPDTLVPENPGS